MICDKCGKNNPTGAQKCSSCGEDMPTTASCGGFYDILNFSDLPNEGLKEKASQENGAEGIDQQNMQKLLKKSDSIIKNTQKNTVFGLVAIGLSLVILISSVVIGVITVNSVKNYEKETTKKINDSITRIEEATKELKNTQSKIVEESEKVSEEKNKGLKEEIIKLIEEKFASLKENES